MIDVHVQLTRKGEVMGNVTTVGIDLAKNSFSVHGVDATGAVVPNAEVTLLRIATGERRQTKTDASGNYSFPLIEIGDYTVTVALAGFKTQTQTHHFELAVPPDFPVAQADEVRIRQVLDNLVSNALKYSPNGGTITVGGEIDPHSVTVYVRDQGVGISERDQDKVFDRFFRVDGALSRST